MWIVLVVLGLFFLFYGLCLGVLSNLNLGIIMTFFIGVFLLVWGILYRKPLNFCRTKGLKIIKNSVLAFLVLELLFGLVIGIYGQSDNASYDEDCVVVLGTSVHNGKATLPLKLRLDKAVEYHKKNPDALIVVTGGQGFQETVTEASVMEEYLINHGVDSNVILKEENATSTNENMRFSKKILDAYFTEAYSVVVITNNFHIYRGVQIAKIEGFSSVSHMHAGLQWYNIIPCYLRESLAVLKMWVLD